MSETHHIDMTDARARQNLAGARDLLALLKPRVMSLVIFTALIGLLMAPGSMHPVLAAIAIICISVGAGASGALNMWFDADIDARMARTRGRPIPRGLVAPGEALGIGIVLSVASVATLGLFVNLVAAGLLAFTIFFYAVIYTMWLKRRTAQNIVIGGAAGALPPVIGWASVTGGVDVLPLLMFALIFFWTPPHFWALSLSRSEEYEAAGVPMLPVTAGAAETRKQILIYTLVLWPVALAPVALGLLGLLYGAAAVVLNGMLTTLAWRLWQRPSEEHANSLFLWSIAHLFLLFLLMPLDHWIGVSLAGVL